MLLIIAGVHPNPGPAPERSFHFNTRLSKDMPQEELCAGLAAKMIGARSGKYWTIRDPNDHDSSGFSSSEEWKKNLKAAFAALRLTHNMQPLEIRKLMEDACEGNQSALERAGKYYRECALHMQEDDAHDDNYNVVPMLEPDESEAVPHVDPTGRVIDNVPFAERDYLIIPVANLTEHELFRLLRARLNHPTAEGWLDGTSRRDWDDETQLIYNRLRREFKRSEQTLEQFGTNITNSKPEAINILTTCKLRERSTNTEVRVPDARFEAAPDQSGRTPLDDEDIPTLAELPNQKRGLWVRLANQVLSGYRTLDQDDRNERIHRLLNLPKYYLRKFKGKASSRVRDKFRDMQLAGQVLHQTGPQQYQRQDDDEAAASIKRNISAAKKLLTRGKLGKACRRLMQENLTRPLFTQAAESLRELHPYTAPENLHIRCPEQFFLDSEPEIFLAAAKKCASAAAVGRTGLSEELILYLLQDDLTKGDMAEVLLDIINNRVSESVRERLTQCRLVAIGKPTKPGTPPGVRPIAVGEAILKIAATVVVTSIEGDIVNIWNNLQFGVGIVAGNEIIAHRVQNGFSTRRITVALDAANAFNTPRRSAIRDQLCNSPALRPLYPLWNLCYSNPSSLYFRQDGEQTEIPSTTGTRQGDVLGALFFAVAIQEALNRARETFPEVDVYAYLDDITLQADCPDAMANCIKSIEAYLRSIGMRLNGSKCEWLSSPEIECPFPAFQTKTDFIKILGSYVGLPQACTDALYNSCATKHKTFFDRLQMLNGTGRMALLGKCGVPKMGYAIRVHDPAISKPAAEDFDKRVVQTWSEFSEVAPDDITRRTAKLDLSRGGCGFTSMCDISQAAYAASYSVAMDGSSEDQTTATCHIHEENYQELCKDPRVKLRLEDCKQRGNHAWFTGHGAVGKIARTASQAAMRIRLGAPHRDLPDEPVCSGCQKVLTRDTFNQHSRGCARVTGMNCAAAHAMVKKGWHQIFATRGISFQYAEPSGQSVQYCRQCHMYVRSEKVDEHCQQRSCDHR